MARRPDPVKKKSPKAAKSPPPAAPVKAKRPARTLKPSIYVVGSACTVTLSSSKPKAGWTRGPLEELPAAKSAVMDALLNSIEQAERLLTAVRRTSSLDELRKVLAATG